MNRKRILIIAACAVVFTAALWALCTPERTGLARFYKDQPYHFNTLRAMGEIPFGGGESAEILGAIKNIPQGDDERWYVEWEKAGARVEKTARSYKNPVSRGYALLRAHSYYRTAEFFLHPKDPRRPVSFDKNRRAFYDGLKALGITHRIIAVPYGTHTLKAVYFPAANPGPGKPLILACGGYDSTLEELFFMIVDGALKRGYSCLTFEGPGQGSIIREQGLQFTHEWEKPTGAVLDRFLGMYPRPRAIVFLGASLGGYLAPRAAAFDRRIDGVAAYDVCYDFQEAALMQVPGFVRFLHRNGFISTVNTLIKLKMKNTPGVRWGVRNAQWTMGAKDPADLLNIFSRYTLKDIAGRINCHVLILAGERDHFFPVHQVDQFRKALVNARSVTARIFTEEEGGHEHCQVGAVNLFHGVFFDWVAETFEK